MIVTESKRLFIREYEPKFRQAITWIFADAKNMEFWPGNFGESELDYWFKEMVEPYQGTGLGRHALIDKATSKVIGDCGIVKSPGTNGAAYELGCVIHHPYWGQGYASEACRAMLEYSFRIKGLDLIQANIKSGETAATRIAEKIGLSFKSDFIHGIESMRLYELDRSRYLERSRQDLVTRFAESPEKKNWMGLATSQSPEDRLMAIDLAVAIKDQIQTELLFLFCMSDHFKIKLRFYNLMDEKHQQMADRAMGAETVRSLDAEESLRYFLASPDEASLEAQTVMEMQDKPLPSYKFLFLKYYGNITGIGMGASKETLKEILRIGRI